MGRLWEKEEAERMRNNNQEKDREREQAVRRQKRQSASEKGTESDRNCGWWCPKCIRNFNVYFPLGLLGFFLFWGAILAKLYLPSSVWGSDHVSSSKSQVSRHTVDDVTPVKTTLPPTQKLPHHPQARIQPQSRQMQAKPHSFQQFLPQSHHLAQPSDHRWSADLNDDLLANDRSHSLGI